MVDSSVFVEYLLAGPLLATVKPFFFESTNATYYVPDTCVVDVANAMRLHQLDNPAFSDRNLRDAMDSFLDLVDTNVAASRDLVVETHVLCRDVSTHASTYIVLARELVHPLCTLDGQQATVADGVGVEVLVPGTPSATAWIRERRLGFRNQP